MKVSIQQQGTRTTVGTQDWTDGVFSSDVKGAIFWGTSATANDTATNDCKLGTGASDGTTHSFHSIISATNGTDPNVTNARMRYDGSNALVVPQPSGSLVEANVSAILATGVTANYGKVTATSYLQNGLLIGGSDIAFVVTKGTHPASTTPVTYTHGLGGTPEVIICQTSIASTADPANVTPLTAFTFWTANDSSALSFSETTLAATTDPTMRFSATGAARDFGRWIQMPGGAYGNTMTISNVGATTFDIAYSGNPSTVWRHNFWCLRGSTRALAAKSGIFKTSTSTGNDATLITGLSRAPSLLFMAMTRFVSASNPDSGETGSSDDSAGCYGIGIACNNNGTTQQACATISQQDNVSTTVSKSRTSATKALMIIDDAGALLTQATVNSWDNSGITLNFDTASASSYWVQYIAISAPNASGSGTLSVSNQGGF